MRIRGGFSRPSDSNELNPEYVKLQRADVLKAHQDQVRALKSEVNRLVEKKGNLEAEFQTAFQDRLKKLEDREAGDKLGERRRATQRQELEKLQENFKAAQEIAAATHRENLEKLAQETRKAESLLALAAEKEETARLNKESVQASLLVLEEQRKDVAARESAIKEAQEKLAKARAALEQESSGMEKRRQDVADADRLLRIARAEHADTLERLEALRAENATTAAKLKAEAEDIRVARENNTQTYLSNLETAKVLKERQNALDERDKHSKARDAAGLKLITEG